MPDTTNQSLLTCSQGLPALTEPSPNNETRTASYDGDGIALPDVAPFIALVERFAHFVHSIEACPQGSAERFVQVKRFEGEMRRCSDFSDYIEWMWEITSAEGAVVRADGPFKHQAEKAVLLMRQFRYLLSLGPK